MGLGDCFEAMGSTFCTAWCNDSLAETHKLCGAVTTTGDPAPGVCIGLCAEGCATPHGDMGANGCTDSSMACYPNDGSYNGGEIAARDSDGTDPAGFCLPGCTSSVDCTSFWSGATVCNTTSGVCGV